MDVLHEGLARLDFEGDALYLLEQKMNAYIAELLLFNKRHRMVNTDDRDEIVVRHILDTLCAVPFMERHTPHGGEVADVGSGAGLPGIPLSCAMPHCHFTLIERMASRASFLQNAAAILHLNNVEVAGYDAAYSPKKRYADIVTARAYSPIDKKSIAIYNALIKDGGIVALYKTPSEAEAARRALTAQAAQDNGVRGYCITPLCVPFMEDRARCIVSWSR